MSNTPIWPINVWIALIALWIYLRMSLRFVYGARGPGRGYPVYTFVNVASWVLLVLLAIPLLVLALMSYVGVILILIAAATFVEAIVQRRAAQRRSMCKLLALTIGRGVRIESPLLLAGQSFHGFVGRANRRLVAELERGVPVTAAIARYPRALPPEAVAYVAAGTNNAARARALDELSEADKGPAATIWRTFLDRFTYLMCVVFVLISIITFMMIWIMPQFDNIFTDFGMELPLATRIALVISKSVVRYIGAPIITVLALLMLVAFFVAICYLADFPVLRPLSDRFLRRRRNGDVLRILAAAAEAQQPLPAVLERLAKVYPSPLLRRGLRRASAAIEKGGNWRQALGDARIINKAEQALLATAEKVGNLPWALRTIADRGEKRATYRLAALAQVLYPSAVLVLAAVIGFFVISMFIPLVALIRNLV